MSKKVGQLIKEARTNADLTQEKLARKIGGGVAASDISKAERGELELSQAVLKKIAKATGVTQASLIGAAKGAGKSTAKKTSGASSAALRLSTAEKKLVEYYRAAGDDARKAAVKALKGEGTDLASTLLDAAASLTGGSKTAKPAGGSITDILGDAIEGLLGGN